MKRPEPKTLGPVILGMDAVSVLISLPKSLMLATQAAAMAFQFTLAADQAENRRWQ